MFFLLFPANPADLLNPQIWMTGFFRPMVSVVLAYIKNLVAPSGVQIISLEIGAPLEILVIASIMLGILVSTPVIGYEFYRFADPALYPQERKTAYSFMFAFTALFIGGALFGLFILSPFIIWTVIIFSGFIGSQPVISVSDFYTTIFVTIIFCGASFTIPAIFVLLVKLRVIGTSIVTKHRIYLYPIIYIITAIITPDGGPLADLALFLPVIVMMEGAVFIAKRYEKEDSSHPGLRIKLTIYASVCKFCHSEMGEERVFCPRCRRSQI